MEHALGYAQTAFKLALPSGRAELVPNSGPLMDMRLYRLKVWNLSTGQDAVSWILEKVQVTGINPLPPAGGMAIIDVPCAGGTVVAPGTPWVSNPISLKLPQQFMLSSASHSVVLIKGTIGSASNTPIEFGLPIPNPFVVIQQDTTTMLAESVDNVQSDCCTHMNVSSVSAQAGAAAQGDVPADLADAVQGQLPQDLRAGAVDAVHGHRRMSAAQTERGAPWMLAGAGWGLTLAICEVLFGTGLADYRRMVELQATFGADSGEPVFQTRDAIAGGAALLLIVAMGLYIIRARPSGARLIRILIPGGVLAGLGLLAWMAYAIFIALLPTKGVA